MGPLHRMPTAQRYPCQAQEEPSKKSTQKQEQKMVGVCLLSARATSPFPALLDRKQSPAIQELPVNSAILSPADGSSVSPYDEDVTVQGYALAGGGRAVVRVDVSADGGETWITAELKPTTQTLNR